MDIKIKTDKSIFNYCARAIIEHDEKILIICVNDASYYHLPGGHVEIGESSEKAVVREIKEEADIDIKIDKLILANEQFYDKNNINNHSLILYYLAKPKGNVSTENFVRMEKGTTKTTKNELRWVTREELSNIDLRPQLIKNFIINNNFDKLIHVIG